MSVLITEKRTTFIGISIIAAFVLTGIFLRSGFENVYITEMLLLAGLSMFVLLAPAYIQALLKTPDTSWVHQSLISIIIILVWCLVGEFVPANGFLAWPLACTGYASLFHFVFLSVKQRPTILSLLLYAFLFLLISIWVVGVIWGGYHLRPTFIETLVVSSRQLFDQGYLNLDTLFHSSIAQMIKHYGAPSAGLDGVPSLYYHYGSHWIMAQLSAFTGIHPVLLYNFGYPILFVPLFFKVFTDFSLAVQQSLFGKRDSGLLFVLLLLCIFIQVPKHLYSGGLLGMAGIANDSFTISLIVFFVALQSWVLFLKGDQKHYWWFVVLTAAMIFAASMIKISTGFLLACLAGYLFLRLKMFLRLRYWIAGVMTVVALGAAIWLAAEAIPFGIRDLGVPEGTSHPFHFYTSTHEFDLLAWIAGFYLWVYLLVALFVLEAKLTGVGLTSSWKQGRSLPMEVAVFTAVVGVIPSFFLTFSGGNSMYFSGLQLFVAAAFVLGYTPWISEMLQNLFERAGLIAGKVIAAILAVALILYMYMEVRSRLVDMFRINVETRQALLGVPSDPEGRFSIDSQSLAFISVELNQAYDSIRLAKYIKSLMALEPGDHPNSLLFINQQQLTKNFFRDIVCLETAFITPAFSGHAMLDGLSYSCDIGVYGGVYYNRNFSGTNPNQEAICGATQQRGFSQVLIYDNGNMTFVPQQCGTGQP